MKKKKYCFNIMRYRNNHCPNSALKRAIEALQKVKMTPASTLPSKVAEIAKKGAPTEFNFNQWNIRYLTKDKYGVFCLHWLVSNGISGNQKYLYNKDYISPNGKVYWRRLAGDMRKV